jgi:O-Antigen ligase
MRDCTMTASSIPLPTTGFISTGGERADALGYAPRARHSVEMLRRAMLWLTGVSGAFVFMEPSPYEVMSLLTMILFVVSGLSLRAALMPLAALLILYNVGIAAAVVPVLDQPKTLLWVLVSAFLSVTALFFAAMLGTNTESRVKVLMRGVTVAGTVAAVAAIVGYFHLVPGLSDILLLYDRARGTFNDPNVLGAFLVLPALLALQRVLASRAIEAARAALLLLLLGAGLFLSFSRGAWGQFALAGVLMLFLEFVTGRSPRERARIVLLAIVGTMALAVLVAALLSIPQVADLFKERAALEQSYDAGPTGRFGRHALGFLLALDSPLGIGPLQFHNIFPEDPHNAYLNSFMSGGWLGGVAYLTIVVVTLVAGFRFAFVATPWRSTYVAVYCAFVGVAGESAIIDTDHWRHYFLMLGVLWGLMAATQAHGLRGRRVQLVRPAAHVAAS